MDIANLPAIVGVAPEPAIPEPISPELVLVDPELRQALLAQESLARVPLQVVPDVESPPPTPPESTPERESVALPKIVWFSDRQAPAPAAPPPQAPEVPATRRRKLVRVILPVSLALNATLIALAVSDATSSPEASPPAPVLDATASGSKPQTSPPNSGQGSSSGSKAGGANGVARPRNGALERKLLNLVVQSPAGKLPRALIDSKTGLAKNGLQAVCRRRNARSFLCVIQPPKHKLGEGLYVRYRLDRKGAGGRFIWYRYRTG
jgi:hypothetical protein